MRVLRLLISAVAVGASAAHWKRLSAPSKVGVEALVQRRLPSHADKLEFAIVNASSDALTNDSFVVSSTHDGKIQITGNTPGALLAGLHRYFSDVVHVDIWWFIGSRLDVAPTVLPTLREPLTGSSVVPYRYHFNTVTTSYTSAFWTWEDWELQLDWMALRGVNLALAWIGVEKIFIEVFQEIGLTDAEIQSFLSGAPFLAWNHMGNIQGSWGGSLPFSWVDGQFDLQKKIVQRMVDLGITPILPAFPGFVPPAITRIWPDVNVANGSTWEGFPSKYTADTFLDPFDPRFEGLQQSFIAKQKAAYGNVTSFYTLDQFNENNPASGDEGYLYNVSQNTWRSLKAADPNAVWVMQGWLFTSSSVFWTNSRIEAFLGGVATNSDLLILDLFSESSPQWQRTNSYYGKPWVFCQLHNYGGNMGLYGQVMNITVNPIAALHNSSSLVGFGLSMEGQEGNEIVYDLLLDQAWSETPIETDTYFHDWVTSRYEGSYNTIPDALYSAWEIVRPTVYNNTHLTANAVPKAIFELIPSKSGLINRTGHHPTMLNYHSDDLVRAWNLMYVAGQENPSLFENLGYQYDLVDWTRQVLANAFIPLYQTLISTWNTTTSRTVLQTAQIEAAGAEMITLLMSLDGVLATHADFRLSTWISAARASAGSDEMMADLMEYEAKNQITLWGPTGQISDYASKSWAGLVSTYYVPRWQKFVDYLVATEPNEYNQTAFNAQLLEWEIIWVSQLSSGRRNVELRDSGDLPSVLDAVVKQWNTTFLTS